MTRQRSAPARRRVVGFSTSAGAFLMLGLTPLATAPANADVADGVIDALVAPFMDAATSTVDWEALLSPAAWEDFLAPAHWDAVFAGLSGLGGSAVPAVSAELAPDVTALFQQFIYAPLHAAAEGWIHSDVGEVVDGVINTAFGSLVIGDGLDGTAAIPDGTAGGWLFGDGGDGWNGTDAGVAGGAGGAAGLFGTGGAGGDGGAGAAGGAGGDGGSLLGIGGAGGDGGDGVTGGIGGDGGSATGLFGVGGHGGDAGNSDNPDGAHVLPALGGAGGNGSALLGSHGAVGHYGSLAGAPPGGASDLSTTGGWIIDSDGRVVILHGFNEVYKIPPYEPSAGGFGDDDAAFLAANGFNVVRLGIIWAGVEPAPGVIDYAYLASIDHTVQILANHGIHTVLDMHQDSYAIPFQGEGAPDWAVQTGGLPNPQLGWTNNYFLNPAEVHAWDSFWSNADAPDEIGLETHYAQMWEAVAGYFNDDPNVVGYELMNEPGAGSQTLPTVLGSPHFGAQVLTPFYNQVASAIRAIDPNTPILFEPTTITQEGLFHTSLGTVEAPHTVFAFHNYCEPLGLPIPCGFTSDLFASRAETYSASHDIPNLMTEFGVPPTDPMRSADQMLTGWMEWAYTGQNDITGGTLAEGVVNDPQLPPTGDNVHTTKLDTLAEPYPRAIAGTPNSWSFENGTFQFSYSTEMADGSGHFGAGAQTEISVPAIEYPNGYQVSVTGGHVVSAAGAPMLVIASDGGAGTVDVTVTPADGAR